MSIVLAQHPAEPPAGPLTAGSLCSGYGGLDLAVTAVTGARLTWVAETDRYAAGVLKHHWAGVPNLGDVTALDWAKVPPVDLVSAGWPCQDISYAGPGAGIAERPLAHYRRRTSPSSTQLRLPGKRLRAPHARPRQGPR